MPQRRSPRLLIALACTCVLSSGCAEPPQREMDQAQGAIDAARAAGADRYAATQYEAAVKALASAQEAVAQRDYRLALNYALDSRERAQSAAREAASQQVALRSDAEHQIAELTAMLDRARQRLAAAESARVLRRALDGLRTAIAEAEASLQKAGAAIQEGDYKSSHEMLAGSATGVQSAMAEIETAMKGRGRRR